MPVVCNCRATLQINWIEVDFAIGFEQIWPKSCQLALIRIDGVKLVIKNDVVLWRNAAGSKVENQRN